MARIHAEPAIPYHVFAGLAFVSASLYAVGITARYPIGVGLNYPGASWAILANFAPSAVILHAIVYALVTLSYTLALRLALRAPQSAGTSIIQTRLIAIILIGWLLCSGVLLGAYPGDSTDVFDYLFRGRMIAEYGLSPLALVPAQFADQPFYAYVHWMNNVDTYGPLWEYESGAVAYIVRLVALATGQTDIPLIFYIIGYRLLAVGLAGLCGILIALLVHRQKPQHVPAALLAWFWNPVLLTATAIGAHNDMLMLVLALVGFWFLQRQHWVCGLLAFLLAAHVKISILLLIPLVLLHILRQCGWWRTVWQSLVVGLIVLPISWLLYAPLGGWETLPRMLAERVRYLVNSLAFVAYWLLQTVFGWPEIAAWQITTQAAILLFCVLAAAQLWRFWRTRVSQAQIDIQLWHAATMLFVTYLIVGSFWFEHWYLLWALAPAVLLPQHRLSLTIVPWLCLVGLWLHLAVDFFLTPRARMIPPPPAPWTTPLLLICLAGALFLLWQWYRKHLDQILAHIAAE